jgi:hypothetical protein
MSLLVDDCQFWLPYKLAKNNFKNKIKNKKSMV